MRMREEGGERTDLRPRHLRQGADELRRGVGAEPEGFLVDDLADGVPKGGFEALGRGGVVRGGEGGGWGWGKEGRMGGGEGAGWG